MEFRYSVGKMLWLIRRTVQLAVLGTAGVQLAGLAQAVHPLFDSIAHFRLHVSILLVLGCLVALAVGAWRTVLIGVATAVAGLAALAPAFPNNEVAFRDNAKTDLVLLQFNTFFKNRRSDKIAALVTSIKPDVVTFQEVSEKTSAALKLLAQDYPHQVLCPHNETGGVAVLSALAPVAQGCANGLGLAWMQVEFHGQRTTIASLHLIWPFPLGQYEQVSGLEPALQALARPVVLAGDFNAAPWSHSVSRIANATGTRVTGGLRMTFRRSIFRKGPFPLLPIDHVLVPPEAAAAISLGEPTRSDHLPLITRVQFGGR
jgi:endonuclease/exonuclease/phosphatase (EEP) superfamily protein YafD